MTQSDKKLLELFAHTKYTRHEPNLMLEADIVRLVAGEDLSSRLFLTQDGEGNELCLRHDYTLPLTLELLKSGALARDYSYFGKVFRHNTGEFLQAGVESFGRRDKPQADAEIVNLAIESVQNYTAQLLKIEMGDVSLILSLIDALGFSKAWNNRLKRDFRRGKTSSKPTKSTSYSGLLSALDGANPTAAKELVSDLLSIAGISTFGGRTISEISERFLEQAALQNDENLDDKINILNKALQLEGTPHEVIAKFEEIAKHADLALDISNAKARNALIPQNITLKTKFAREPDYYDGLVFEIHVNNKRVAGGGRYDRMTQLLNAKSQIPAVGFSLWIDGLNQLGGK